MNYAAIDIGSNAGRLLIGYVIPQGDHYSIKKASLTRVPLRLGDDVFSKGKIGKKKEEMLLDSFKAFSHLMKVYDVRHIKAYATSAMREAENSSEIIEKIIKETGISLELIDGQKEADLIFSTFHTQKLEHDKSYLFIDVGGGSTELTIIKNGKRVVSKSFKVGTIRFMKGSVKDSVWDKIKKWLSDNMNGESYAAIGTGGNATRIIKISGNKYLEPLKIAEFNRIKRYVESFTYEERIEQLRMKPDRADVIVPASNIYLKIMDLAKITEIYVPKMGLADGMILSMYMEEKDKK